MSETPRTYVMDVAGKPCGALAIAYPVRPRVPGVQHRNWTAPKEGNHLGAPSCDEPLEPLTPMLGAIPSEVNRTFGEGLAGVRIE
jgi:hypothetical protein